MTEAEAQAQLLKVFRWMRDNVSLSAGIYCDKAANTLTFDPHLHVNGCVVTRPAAPDVDLAKYQPKLNSSTALTVCCYIEALGKLLLRGTATSETRFKRFCRDYLDGFRTDATAHKNAGRFQSWRHASERLYGVFRNGFAHEFAHPDATWTREGRTASYWIPTGGALALNVDRLAAGFLAGLDKFEADAQAGTLTGAERASFLELAGHLSSRDEPRLWTRFLGIIRRWIGHGK